MNTAYFLLIIAAILLLTLVVCLVYDHFYYKNIIKSIEFDTRYIEKCINSCKTFDQIRITVDWGIEILNRYKEIRNTSINHIMDINKNIESNMHNIIEFGFYKKDLIRKKK